MSTLNHKAFASKLNRRGLLKTGAVAGAAVTLPQFGALAMQDAAPSDISGTFRAMSWETEAEMRKWFLHMDRIFEETYVNMDHEVEYGISWNEYWTKLQTTIAGGGQLDMCWMHDSRVQSYADLETLIPLDDYISASPPVGWPDEFYQSQVQAFQHEGVQYGIPYDYASGGFYVNLDVLERAGVDVPTEDWTFDQLLEAGIKIKESADNPSEQWGFALPTTSHNTHWIVKSFGGEQVTTDPLTSHFNDPATIAAYQFIYDAIWTHEVMQTPETLEALGMAGPVAFASGQIGLMFSLNDEAFVFSELVGEDSQWTMAPTPRGESARIQFVGGSAFSIPVAAEYPDVAYEVLKFMATDPENLPITGEMGSMFVAVEDYWEYALPPEEDADPEVFTKVFYELAARDGQAPLYFPGYQQWDSSIYQVHMQRLWAGATDDVEGTLNALHEETQAYLDSLG